MSFVRRTSALLALLVLATLLASCDNAPTGPGTGSGNLLTATINGTSYTFTLAEVRYDSTIHYAYVLGTASGAATKSITITFVSDITTGSFPRTLSGDAINIIYIDDSGARELVYDCSAHRDQCTMTLTSSDGRTADGTFSGTLTERTDASSVTVTGGRFSVTLR
jgi:hypothetical protein